MSISECCLKGFEWSGTPTGRVDKLGDLDVYITGTNTQRAILYVNDVYGYTFTNNRLLADHYAREIDATVYLPDFFHGEILPSDLIRSGQWDKFDISGFMQRNSRDIREPEILESARLLRQQFPKLGAVGYCYGGWAVCRLAAATPKIVDCVVCCQPSLLTQKDVDEVAVPIQVQAPENDFVYSKEMKDYTFRVLSGREVYFEYLHFPGVEHGCLVRGDPNVKGEREAMTRGKNAAVHWFKQFLCE